MNKIRGKLKLRFLLLTVFVIALPTFIFYGAITASFTGKYNDETIVIAYMFGLIALPPIIMILRFYKILSINSDVITIYYPFLFFIRQKINIKDITGSSTFERSFFRKISWNREYIEHQFKFYKTSKNHFFLISDFNFKNYNEIISYIDKENNNSTEVFQFFRTKHQIILLIIIFLTIFSLAITAG